MGFWALYYHRTWYRTATGQGNLEMRDSRRNSRRLWCIRCLVLELWLECAKVRGDISMMLCDSGEC